MLGLRELAMVATVVLVLYGRSGVLRSRRFQARRIETTRRLPFALVTGAVPMWARNRS